MKNLKVTITA